MYRIIVRKAQMAAIENRQYLDDGESTANVHRGPGIRHVQNGFAQETCVKVRACHVNVVTLEERGGSEIHAQVVLYLCRCKLKHFVRK